MSTLASTVVEEVEATSSYRSCGALVGHGRSRTCQDPRLATLVEVRLQGDENWTGWALCEGHRAIVHVLRSSGHLEVRPAPLPTSRPRRAA